MIRALSDAEIHELAAAGAAQLRAERTAAAPTIVNLENALALGQPLELTWSGRTHRLRPLRYREGLRAERYLREVARPAAEFERDAGRLAEIADFLGALLIDQDGANPFEGATPAEIVRLLEAVAAVPDEARRPAPVASSEAPPPHDTVDALAEFAREFPAWMRDGEPLSWRHFAYGHAHLARAHARAALRSAGPASLAFMKEPEARDWFRTQRLTAGWER